MAAIAAILFVACLVLKLDELGISPLRGILALARRPWFERFLVLFLVGGLVILVSTLTTYGRNNSGVGPAYPSYTADIQNVMDELSDRNGKPRETLRYFDFSSYPALREN